MVGNVSTIMVEKSAHSDCSFPCVALLHVLGPSWQREARRSQLSLISLVGEGSLVVFWTTQTPWHGERAREDDAVAAQAAGALLDFNAILNGLGSASRVSHSHIHSASEACKVCLQSVLPGLWPHSETCTQWKMSALKAVKYSELSQYCTPHLRYLLPPPCTDSAAISLFLSLFLRGSIQAWCLRLALLGHSVKYGGWCRVPAGKVLAKSFADREAVEQSS